MNTKHTTDPILFSVPRPNPRFLVLVLPATKEVH
jgi:hypothetical protein